MAHFMCHSDMRDCGWNVFAIIEQSDDPSVEGLQTSTVMLKKKKGELLNNLCHSCKVSIFLW